MISISQLLHGRPVLRGKPCNAHRRCLDEAWADRVYAYPFRHELGGKYLGERSKRRFRSGVDAQVPSRRTLGERREDNRAALADERGEALSCEERALRVDVEHVVVCGFGNRVERPELRDTGIDEEKVEAPELLLHHRTQCVDVCQVCRIGSHHQSLRVELTACGVEVPLVTASEEHLRTLVQQRLDGGESHPVRSTDDGRFLSRVLAHWNSPSLAATTSRRGVQHDDPVFGSARRAESDEAEHVRTESEG